MSDSYLITGGTGSFGSAIVRALLNAKRPERIVVFSRDEHKQFVMRNALPDDPRLRWFLGDVRDRSRLRRAFEGVRYVVHAAAMKHVGAAEYNPGEALRTNCDGTQNVIEAALDAGVQRSLLISTDKAVNPSSLYGATKLVAERLFLAAPALAGSRGCQFSVLRCGNLIGSRGSVVPYWRGLIARFAEKKLRSNPGVFVEQSGNDKKDMQPLRRGEFSNTAEILPRVPRGSDAQHKAQALRTVSADSTQGERQSIRQRVPEKGEIGPFTMQDLRREGTDAPPGLQSPVGGRMALSGASFDTTRDDDVCTLPVTDPQATRYWLDEAGAVHAVLRALHGPYAALTVPEMLAFRVGDLAEAFGMPTRLIGLRAGEKLHEELGDGRDSSSAPRLTVSELRKLLEQHGFGGTAPDEAG